MFHGALHLLFGELAVLLGKPLLKMGDLVRAEKVEQPGRLRRGRAQCLPDLGLHRIVTPFEVLAFDATKHARGGVLGELCILGQRLGPVPGEECR